MNIVRAFFTLSAITLFLLFTFHGIAKAEEPQQPIFSCSAAPVAQPAAAAPPAAPGAPAGPAAVSIAMPAAPPAPYTKITGPFTSGNLSIFLLHGPDKLKGKTYLTLAEAMDQKKVVVHETGNVNELSIENTGDDDCYIQSGDIVKGGQQDRTIQQDFILSKHSGKVPINAFCVEHGRWTGRPNESAQTFDSSHQMLAGKEIKLAARAEGDQSKVWSEVAANQKKLSDNVGAPVASAASPSSFQLTLESPRLKENTDQMIKELGSEIEGQDDTIGYAFAINGKINSVEIYGSHALFVKLWPKLLQSAATEAVAEAKKDAKFDPATPTDLNTCISDANHASPAEKQITPRVNVIQRESEKNILFETHDKDQDNLCVHSSYIAK